MGVARCWCRSLAGLCFCDLALTDERVEAGDLATHPRHLGGVLELTRGIAEAQVERLLLRLSELGDELGEAQLGQGTGLGGHQTTSSREMTRALIGSFWTALSIAMRACTGSGNDSSKSTRPGLTTATQSSGLPLPEPIRVSAGFLVTGLSGKTLIHTLPPRLMARVMAMRAASIWRAVIHPGSRAWMPYSPKASEVPPLATPLVRPR